LAIPKSAAQLVYDQLKKKIIDFEIYPGTRITESEIAEDFQVSRTPVRAALQRLEAEGQISIMPKQGCFVRSVDIESISQYYDVRITLEATAVELACDHMSDEDIDALQEVWDPERLEKKLDMEEIKAREEAFHIGIAIGSGMVSRRGAVRVAHGVEIPVSVGQILARGIVKQHLLQLARA